jgi:hypothetical protein
LRQWPTVERFALACYPHPEAVGDALRSILWGARGRFSPMPADQRAKQLHVRADTFRRQTRRAEALLRDWLNRVAWGFLLALHDDGTTADTPVEGWAISLCYEPFVSDPLWLKRTKEKINRLCEPPESRSHTDDTNSH